MIPETNLAALAVLNVGEGDMKFSFDTADVQEVARAERIVNDMLHRGYALFAEVGGKLKPVLAFNAKTSCYILADGPAIAPVKDEPQPVGEPSAPARKRGRPKKTEVPLKGTKVTSVPRSAGG